MGRIIPYTMENKKCLEPPTSYVSYMLQTNLANYGAPCCSFLHLHAESRSWLAFVLFAPSIGMSKHLSQIFREFVVGLTCWSCMWLPQNHTSHPLNIDPAIEKGEDELPLKILKLATSRVYVYWRIKGTAVEFTVSGPHFNNTFVLPPEGCEALLASQQSSSKNIDPHPIRNKTLLGNPGSWWTWIYTIRIGDVTDVTMDFPLPRPRWLPCLEQSVVVPFNSPAPSDTMCWCRAAEQPKNIKKNTWENAHQIHPNPTSRDVSENSVPLNIPKPNGCADHYPYEKWLFHWEY